ncbi:MAG: carbon-nitrogen hydrolase family protein [Verrucomicrobia bacterium]|nr:carbon-nitrogen hydrolase family protein [Verrucomicrobiota bacterium]
MKNNRLCVGLMATTLLWSACVLPAASPEQIGRPVRVVSIAFRPRPLEAIVPLVDGEGAKGADLIILPETMLGQKKPQPLDGPAVTTMSNLARKHRTYIVCSIDRLDGARRVNSAALIDRAGKVVCVYDKVYPYWAEFDLKPPVEPRSKTPVYQVDFGRIGMAVCFDVNFPDVWKRLADQGAELIVWPSAYSAGSSLRAHAINHHFHIVTCTYAPDCSVFDITGEEVLYEKGRDIQITRATLDLDRGIYHENFNVAKRDKLLKEHGDDVILEKRMQREAWFVLRAKRPGVSARELARRYGLEELRDYLDRSRREIDRMREQTAGKTE